jgi:crotonobetaine/carnitine-CoA ligase
MEGYFMTSDLVVPVGENRVRFLGRVDNIVKVAGKRVDLEEVREKIKRIPGVTDAAGGNRGSRGERPAPPET